VFTKRSRDKDIASTISSNAPAAQGLTSIQSRYI